MTFSSDPAIRMLELLDRRLRDGSANERATAASRFARRMGAGRKPLPLSRLVRFLRVKVPQESHYLPRATAAVLALETKSAEALTHVARYFASEQWCAQVLGGALLHRHPLIRKHARQALDANFSAKPIRSELIEDLSNPSREVRQVAAHLLQSNCCDVLPPDLPLHRRYLKDDVPAVRSFALRSLGKVLQEAMTSIREALKDPAGNVRASAAVAMCEIGEEIDAVIPHLTALLSKTSFERRCAAMALGPLNRAHLEFQAPLIRNVASSDWATSDGAIRALAGSNRALDDHRALLLRMLRHRLPHIRANATFLLRYLVHEKDKTVPYLVQALDDAEPTVRKSAVAGFRWMGSAGKPLLPRLASAMKRAPLEKKIYYGMALSALDASPPDLVAVLLRGLKVRDLRLDCLSALGSIGPRAKAAIPALRRAMKSRDLNVSTFARNALESIERR